MSNEKVNQLSTARDQNRLIQSLTLLVPARRFSVDFEFTMQMTLPAIIESALKLLSTLDGIQSGELQLYFGLNDLERESLIIQLQRTGMALLDEKGKIVPTQRLLDLRRDNLSLQIEEIESHHDYFVVDLLTYHVQPRSDESPLRGLPEIHATTDVDKSDFSAILQQQFRRFQNCTNRPVLQASGSKLYRINYCEFERVTTVPLSLDISALRDPMYGLRLDASLRGYNEQNERLISSSGLVGCATKYLNKLEPVKGNLSFVDYCGMVEDSILGRYDREDWFDLEEYLSDRHIQETAYGNENTRGVLGPIYMDNNIQLIMSWLETIPETDGLNPMLWWPADTELWGASSKMRKFTSVLQNSLEKHNSSLSLVFSGEEKAAAHEIKTRFGGRISKASLLPSAKRLCNMEMLIMPGEHCWAMVQYHIFLKPEWGLSGLTLPVGYITTDPESVKNLWKILTEWTLDNRDSKQVLGSKGDLEIVINALNQSWESTIKNSKKLKGTIEKVSQRL